MVIVHEGIDRRHAEETVAGARNAIELKGVAKEYKAVGGGAFRAVAGVDLEDAEGEFVALVGPSGCGKTTLLRMISACRRGIERLAWSVSPGITYDGAHPRATITAFRPPLEGRAEASLHFQGSPSSRGVSQMNISRSRAHSLR